MGLQEERVEVEFISTEKYLHANVRFICIKLSSNHAVYGIVNTLPDDYIEALLGSERMFEILAGAMDSNPPLVNETLTHFCVS